MAAKESSNKSQLKSWYSNRYQIVIVQRNILLLLTVLSMISVAISVIFVKTVISSKSLEPYVIEVEEKTGVPTVVSQLTTNNFTGDEMVKKYFINQFIQANNGYDPRTYNIDKEKVRLMASQKIYFQFLRDINEEDLGNNSIINVRIKSIQFPSYNTAQVRILREIRRRGDVAITKNEVIDMEFAFVDLNLSLEERFISPLGFQVKYYKITDELFTF